MVIEWGGAGELFIMAEEEVAGVTTALDRDAGFELEAKCGSRPSSRVTGKVTAWPVKLEAQSLEWTKH